MKRVAIFCCAALLFSWSNTWGQTLPSDLDELLRKNVDKYVFKSFTIRSQQQDQYGLWVCGKIAIQTFAGGVASNFVETNFVGQILPDESIPGSRSVIYPAGPLMPSGHEYYDRYCK